MAQKPAAARSGDSESAGAKAAGGYSGAVVEVSSRAQRQPAELQVSVAGALESSRAQRQPAELPVEAKRMREREGGWRDLE